MQSKVIAHYALKPDALERLAALNDELRNRRGKPAQDEIARRAGLHPWHFSRVKNGHTVRLGEQVMSGLLNLAMEHGVSRAKGEQMLFDFIPASAVQTDADETAAVA